jgi:hypothetical protein
MAKVAFAFTGAYNLKFSRLLFPWMPVMSKRSQMFRFGDGLSIEALNDPAPKSTLS